MDYAGAVSAERNMFSAGRRWVRQAQPLRRTDRPDQMDLPLMPLQVVPGGQPCPQVRSEEVLPSLGQVAAGLREELAEGSQS
jgi:hypothetical protein